MLLQFVTGITKRYSYHSLTESCATENLYNVWQALQSVIKKLLDSIRTITT